MNNVLIIPCAASKVNKGCTLLRLVRLVVLSLLVYTVQSQREDKFGPQRSSLNTNRMYLLRDNPRENLWKKFLRIPEFFSGETHKKTSKRIA